MCTLGGVHRIVLILVCLVSWAGTAWGQPRVILVLSVDQMRYDYLTRFQPIFQGGFKTLLDRGAVYSNALYRHSASETGPGHSVILTGRHASSTGIVANTWYDRYLKKQI